MMVAHLKECILVFLDLKIQMEVDMAKHKGKGKFKPYNSPGHVHDHPVHNMPDPSGGMDMGSMLPGAPMPPGGAIGQGLDQQGAM